MTIKNLPHKFSFVNSYLNLGKKYGYYTLIKIVIFELINFKFKKIYEYKFKKPLKVTSESYIPSFYYALSIVKKKIKLSNKTLIDFGCGRGRVLRYFQRECKEVIGIEFDTQYKKYFSKNEVIWGDCYDDVLINDLINDISIKSKKELLILYFYHPFEEKRINLIIKKFRDKFRCLHFVLVGGIDLYDYNKNRFELLYKNKLIKIYRDLVIQNNEVIKQSKDKIEQYDNEVYNKEIPNRK